MAHRAEDRVCSPGRGGLAMSLQEPGSGVHTLGLQALAWVPCGVWPQSGSGRRTSFLALQSGFANERALVFVRTGGFRVN